MPSHEHQVIVIVGAGHAGVQAAATLRAASYQQRLVIIDQDPELPYQRPPLSKGLLLCGATSETIRLRKPAFYQEKKIELRTRRAVQIDAAAQRVHCEDGSAIAYDALVLATGSKPLALDIPGRYLPGVFELRSLADAVAFKASLAAAKRLVVVGAGYIGLEVAAAAVRLGKGVLVLEREERVMKRVACETVSRFFHDLHVGYEVDLQLGSQIASFEGCGRVEWVVVADGRAFEADTVIVGTGVAPAQDLAAAAGIACDDGIVVDRFGRTSDPAIYAAGDVTRHDNEAVGTRIRLECVQNAVSQAEVLARAILGDPAPYREVPWFWTDQYHCRLQSAGLRLPGDREVMRGDPASGSFSVLHLRDGRLAAIDTLNALKDFLPGKKLIQERRVLDLARLGDPVVPLSEAAENGLS